MNGNNIPDRGQTHHGPERPGGRKYCDPVWIFAVKWKAGPRKWRQMERWQKAALSLNYIFKG